MKRNRIYIILFLVLGGIAAYLYLSRSSSTIKEELRDFAVKDTASVDKIFMADRQGKTVLLERRDTGWEVNNRFPARQDAISTLLATVNGLEVRSPVGKNLYNTTMKLLASNSVKVELYSRNELIKTFYVGHSTMDNLGTFMYLEGSSVPFIMHIPGFNGYLTPRFFTNENDWRQRTVFAYQPGTISKVEVKDPHDPSNSFEITRAADTVYVVTSNGQPVKASNAKLYTYLGAFTNSNYEKIETAMPKYQQDSLLTAGPFRTIKVEGLTPMSVALYRRPLNPSSLNHTDAAGNPLPFDLDRLYIRMNDDTTWYVGQYFTFDRLLKTPSYFIEGEQAKK